MNVKTRKLPTVLIWPGLWLAAASLVSAQRIGDTPVRRIAEAAPVAVVEVRFGLPVTDGLALHLAADAIDGLADGERVAYWRDLSDGGRHAIQGIEANRPSYHPGVLNGFPVVRFDGSSRYLIGPGLGITGAGGSTTLVVMRRNSMSQTANTGVFSYGDASGAGGTVRRYSIDTDGLGVRFNNGNRIFNDPTGTATYHLLTHLNADGASYGAHRLWIDGSEAGQASTASPATIPNIGDDEYLVAVGRSGTGTIPTGNYFQGDIAEIVVYNRALSLPERETVEQYLGEKWLGWRPLAPPGQPDPPRFQNVYSTALTVVWSAPADGGAAAEYELERAPDQSGIPGDFALIAVTNRTVRHDSSVQPETAYWYRVRAVNPLGHGPYSAPAQVTTSDQAPPFPLDGLLLWLDADAIDDLASGDSVGQWDDRSGAGHHAVQAVPANRPTWQTNVLSGRPVVRFDGNSRFLAGTGLGITGSRASTAIILMRRNSMAQAINTSVLSYGTLAGAVGTVRRYSLDTDGLGVRFNNGNRIFSDPTDTVTFYILTHRHATGASYGQHRLFLNGTELGQVSSGNPTYVPDIGDDEYLIASGRNADGTLPAGAWFSGDIAEILVYDRDMTDPERQAAEQYLGEKWLGW